MTNAQAQSMVIATFGRLGFKTPTEDLAALLIQASNQQLSLVQLCEQLAAREQCERDQRNLACRMRMASLGKYKPFDQFDWNHPRQLDRVLIESLCTLDFIKRGENVLFRGPSGCGKTMLAKNIGLLALKQGYTVRFDTLAMALGHLSHHDSLAALERRIRRYTTPALWICDEIGYLPCDMRGADLFFNIISRRHEHNSVIITTNLSFKQWTTVFPGAACLSALVDRFVQYCHVVDIDADSWREREAKTFLAKTSASRGKALPPTAVRGKPIVKR